MSWIRKLNITFFSLFPILSILPTFLFVLCFLVNFTPVNSWALTPDEKNSIAIYKKASPGVVNITSIVLQRDFFYGVVPREGAGSGAIIDSKGYIITNEHVIKDARRIEVTLSDGSKWPGKLIGTDPLNDLAVIQINAPPEQLHPLKLGSSKDLEEGRKVIAIGNPFGLHQTLTTGIISSLDRSIQAEGGKMMDGLIQTDAAINPGNSGGPMLNSDGEVIGFNTAIFSPSGGSVGIGFAIPVDTAKRIIPDLISKGYVPHVWLGVTLMPLIPGLAEGLGLRVERGAMIIEVVQGAPADQAGLKGGNRMLSVGNALLPVGGDVIVSIDGTKVISSQDLIKRISKYRPKNKVTLKILRNNQFMNIDVVLEERPR